MYVNFACIAAHSNLKCLMRYSMYEVVIPPSCAVQIHNNDDGDGDGDSTCVNLVERWRVGHGPTNRTYVRWFGCMLEFEGVVGKF